MNSSFPTSKQILFLWSLVVRGGSAFKKDIKPDIKSERKGLEEAGLIELVKRQPPDSRKGARAFYVMLTDRGWEWLSEHMDASVSGRSPVVAHILAFLQQKLKLHLQQQEIAFADFVSAGAKTSSLPGEMNGKINERVRATYATLANGHRGVRVRLADLRRALPDVPRAELDPALRTMELEGTLILYCLQNPLEIQAEDRDAALLNSVGEPRHVIYMES